MVTCVYIIEDTELVVGGGIFLRQIFERLGYRGSYSCGEGLTLAQCGALSCKIIGCFGGKINPVGDALYRRLTILQMVAVVRCLYGGRARWQLTSTVQSWSKREESCGLFGIMYGLLR